MVLEEKKLEILQKILDKSTYTVALCGSGVVTECGQRTLKSPEMAYDMEEKYGVSPEEIFTTVYYHNRTAQFFEFYREEILRNPASTYTVALCGSGVVTECGQRTLKSPEMAYDMEEKYGVSPEEIFTTVYYHNRTAQFFEFYREEILRNPASVTETAEALRKMEKMGKLQCIIDSNIYSRSFAENGKNGEAAVYY